MCYNYEKKFHFLEGESSTGLGLRSEFSRGLRFRDTVLEMPLVAIDENKNGASRSSFRKVQVLITDFHFAKYRFHFVSFRKALVALRYGFAMQII